MDKGYYKLFETREKNYVYDVAIHNKNGQGLLQWIEAVVPFFQFSSRNPQ